jgi:hypothetical protein
LKSGEIAHHGGTVSKRGAVSRERIGVGGGASAYGRVGVSAY